MKSSTIRRWSFIHTWTSLICTLFLLLLALTGLPLIFEHEINLALGSASRLPVVPPHTREIKTEPLIQAVLAQRPGEVVQYLAWDEHEPNGMLVITAPTAGTEPNASHTQMIDIHSGKVVETPAANGGLMQVMLRLHTDLFIGPPGKWLMAVMGVLFILAIISGVVLYAPFMRRLKFASVRQHKSTRTRWLDLHNLIGIVSLTWMLVVGTTGAINACADFVIDAWRNNALASMIAPYKDLPPSDYRASSNLVVDIAEGITQGMEADFVAFPGTRFSSPHHYTVFMRGKQRLTAHVWTPVLIDSRTLRVTAVGERPWYMNALGVAQPLHFGDYGGLPMRILWALLDVLTLIMLGSGLYLWWVRRAKNPRPTAMGAAHEG